MKGQGVPTLAIRHKAQSGSDRPSCLSQDPCCQFRVPLGGEERGVSLDRGGGGQIKIGDWRETLSRIVMEVISREMVNKCWRESGCCSDRH